MNGKIQWICPNCNWTKYNTVNIFDKITLHICDKCSIVFGDPYKFNLITSLNKKYSKFAEIDDRIKKLFNSIKNCSKILLQKDKNEKKIKLK